MLVMKALVHTAPYTFDLRDVDRPAVKPDEVLVRVKAVGICGSDVHGMTGTTGRRIPPVVMGHEASGEVLELGSPDLFYSAGGGTGAITVGDRVTFDSTIYCNRCDYCLSGRINLCRNRRVLGVSCDEYRRDGAMAELVAIPAHILYPIPDTLDFHRAALIEPCSIAFHAVQRHHARFNETVHVVGCGIIGLLTILSARAAGCGRIIATDLKAERLEKARRLGAEVVINAGDGSAARAVRDATGGDGADVCFEAVGVEPTVKLAIESVKKGGPVVLIGNVTPEVSVPLQRIVTGELDVLGSCASAGEYAACVAMVASGRLDVGPLISEVAPLDRGASWFERLHEGTDGLFKVILEPS